ncbi:organic solute transporter subunit alpha-like [Mya arenaria]|uniref:organic solute transporter subunit alpha-like n=1 Tax=Mya arenaria TaxID=6604 RepID=UPI0022E259EA|nr:organic solute transporter subunit alpha-like [Mya arenaria]
MTNCSNEFPTTDIYYDEIGSDTGMLVCLGIAGALTLVCVGIFVEEVSFVRRHYSYQVHGNIANKMIIILALFPVMCITKLIPVFVPTSNVLLALMATCYISVCIYVFVTLTISLYGGGGSMVSTLRTAGDQVSIANPPCCCCLFCCLKPITLSRKSLGVFKLLAMQMMIVRPFLLFIAAVLWTDGKYEEQMDPREPYVYIAILSTVSTLLSMYGLIVIYRASRTHLSHFSLVLKFVPFQAMMALDGIQMHVFNFLAYKDIPECVGQLGSRVRGTNFNNLLLVLESFLLCLLARRGYRMVPPDHIIDPMNPVQGINTAKDNTGGYQYGSLGHEDS